MPNRIIKETICSSADLDKLNPFEETVFYRLIVNVDDFGRIDARLPFLKSKLFVTKPGITEKSVQDAILKLASIGIVRYYEVDCRPFLLFPKWELHQQVRAQKSKYPDPPDSKIDHQQAEDGNGNHLISDDINGNQMMFLTNSYSYSNSKSKSYSKKELSNDNSSCTEMSASAPSAPPEELPPEKIPKAQEPVFCELTCNGKKSVYPVTEAYIAQMQKLYPGIDVAQETLLAQAWLENNPKRRKTYDGITRYLGNWYAKSQNRAPTNGNGSRASPTTQRKNPYEHLDAIISASEAEEAREAIHE